MIWGVGEMGGVFARGLLRNGLVVMPVNRGDDPGRTAGLVPDPEIVLVGVAERDLSAVLAAMPARWQRRVCLLQNELLPRDWEVHRLPPPTVVVAWFEKKAHTGITVIAPSPVAGEEAPLAAGALAAVGVATFQVETGEPLVHQLVRKNLYILTANIAGMVAGGTVGELWTSHHALCIQVAAEIIALQQALVGRPLNTAALVESLGADFAADPNHGATGRSAPDRLRRALRDAATLGVPTPRLEAISRHAAT